MKYLKKFESVSNRNVQTIKEYCENYLAYIMEYFTIDIIKKDVELFRMYGNNGDKYVIRFYRKGDYFTWDKVKDHFIPFFNMLVNDYNVADRIRLIDWGDDVMDITIDDILKDKIGEIINIDEDNYSDVDINMIDNIIFCVI